MLYYTHKQTYAGETRPLELIQTMPKMQLKRLQCFMAYHRKEFTENRITFHGLRHSCASLLIAQGVDIKIIQEWLGHSSIATTGNIYGHLQFKQKISTGTVLENLLA